MGGGGGEERLGLWCTFEVASPTVHTTFEGGGSWGEGGRSISAATSNLLSTSRITESALWNLLKVRVRRHWEGRMSDLLDVMDGKEEAAWLEGDSPSTPSSTCSFSLWPPPLSPSSSLFDFPPSSSVGPAASLTAVISAPLPASSMLLSRLERELIEVLPFHKTADNLAT